MSFLANLQQIVVIGHDTGPLVLGAILLAVGIILGHFFPNRYWIVLIAAGIVLIVIYFIVLALSYVGFVIPYAPN